MKHGKTQVEGLDVKTELDKIAVNETAIGLNTTHKSSDGSDHSKIGDNETAIGLNTTHRGSDGSDHSKVGTNASDIITIQEDVQKNEDNLMINAFRIAVNGSLSQFNMIDGIIDEYEDEASIDTVNSINESYDAGGDFYSPSGGVAVSSSPYAHYKMNDNAGNTIVVDSGSGSNNGTSSTNTSNLSDTGKINESFNFDDVSSEYINVGDNSGLQADIETDTTGSFSCWIYAEDITNIGAVFSLGDTDASTYFSCRINAPGKIQIVMANAGDGGGKFDLRSPDNAITINTWHHLVVVQDGVKPKIYIDNVEQTLVNTDTTDTTVWFNSMSAGLDNGRIGCFNINSLGNIQFWDGKLDDFRYYQNKVLTTDEISAIYNGGSGTEDDTPTGPLDNMTLISDTFISGSAPDAGRIVILEEDVDSIALNTDLKAWMSIDAGINWHQGTLSDEGNYDASKKILVASFDVSAETDTDVEYKLETLNNKNLKIHGTGLSWD